MTNNDLYVKILCVIFFERGVVLPNFIDLHNHSLFGVDDGAQTLDMAKKMLDIAYNDGIKTICITPHFKAHHFSDDTTIFAYNDRISKNFLILTDYVKAKYPDMTLLLGNEIMFHNDICDSLSSKKCRSLGQSKYVLIEFKPETPEYEIKNTISRVLRRGYNPIIAHIERYTAFHKNKQLLDTFANMGALLQVNALSVVKFKFGKTARLIKYALKKALVSFICTDAHNDADFSPILSNAYKIISSKYGVGYANNIFFENQSKILNS